MKKRSRTKTSKSKGFRVLEENEPKRVPRGEDMYGYGEQKKQMCIALTDTAKGILLEVSEEAGLSQSEFLERLLRNLKR